LGTQVLKHIERSRKRWRFLRESRASGRGGRHPSGPRRGRPQSSSDSSRLQYPQSLGLWL
jgi:hypothetical protein